MLRTSSRRLTEVEEGLPLAASLLSGSILASTLAARERRALVTLAEMFFGLMVGLLPRSRLTRRIDFSAFLTTSEKRARSGATVGAGVAGALEGTWDGVASGLGAGLCLAVTVDHRFWLPIGCCLSGALDT